VIYLDNNATTAIDPDVADVIATVYRQGPANASSQHAAGRSAAALMEQSLETIAGALGTDFSVPGGPRLIFTSGGTESNHLAVSGIQHPDRGRCEGPIVLSKIEHPSVLATAESLSTAGRPVRWIPVDRHGTVLTETLPQLISGESTDDGFGKAGLVSLMSANNETGVIQPIEQVARLCREQNVPLHVDATQSIGKVPVRLDELGCSAITFTAHKLHGPVGVGALWLAAGVKLSPTMHGGQQQLESRPGTEPVALIAGMAEAIRIATDNLAGHADLMRMLRDRLEQSIQSQHDSVVIHGQDALRLPNTSFISFLGADRQSMLMATDMDGIACSSGAACSSGSSPPSHVLQAMGCDRAEVASALRFGVSRFSTLEEIDIASERISLIYKRLRQK
tara:strand:+ start:155648 stop:156826 length:1179 start_codon:yes stop_codon:yes gene_type:complete